MIKKLKIQLPVEYADVSVLLPVWDNERGQYVYTDHKIFHSAYAQSVWPKRERPDNYVPAVELPDGTVVESGSSEIKFTSGGREWNLSTHTEKGWVTLVLEGFREG